MLTRFDLIQLRNSSSEKWVANFFESKTSSPTTILEVAYHYQPEFDEYITINRRSPRTIITIKPEARSGDGRPTYDLAKFMAAFKALQDSGSTVPTPEELNTLFTDITNIVRPECLDLYKTSKEIFEDRGIEAGVKEQKISHEAMVFAEKIRIKTHKFTSPAEFIKLYGIIRTREGLELLLGFLDSNDTTSWISSIDDIRTLLSSMQSINNPSGGEEHSTADNAKAAILAKILGSKVTSLITSPKQLGRATEYLTDHIKTLFVNLFLGGINYICSQTNLADLNSLAGILPLRFIESGLDNISNEQFLRLNFNKTSLLEFLNLIFINNEVKQRFITNIGADKLATLMEDKSDINQSRDILKSWAFPSAIAREVIIKLTPETLCSICQESSDVLVLFSHLSDTEKMNVLDKLGAEAIKAMSHSQAIHFGSTTVNKYAQLLVYKHDRASINREYYSIFSSMFGGRSRTEKLRATDAALNHLKANTAIAEEDQKILSQGNLGKIYRS